MLPELKAYLSAERGRTATVARSLGIPAGYLSQMASGDRPVPPELAHEMSRHTGIAIWHLCPSSWWRIWPYLLKRPDAPTPHGKPPHRSQRARTFA